MKKTIFVLAVLVVSVVFAGLAWAEEKWEIRDGKLIRFETKKTGEFPAPPGGVSVENAAKLIKGELSEYVLELEGKRENKFVKLFPAPVRRTVIPRTEITYKGEWKVEKLSPKESEKKSWLLLIFLIIIPSILILIVTVLNQRYNRSNRRYKNLLIFYGVILGSMLAGVSIGMAFGMNAGLIAGVFTSGFAGLIAGMFAGGGDAGGDAGGLAGMLAGMIAGGLAVMLAGEGTDLYILSQYVIFILLVCLGSFLLSVIFRQKKKDQEQAV